MTGRSLASVNDESMASARGRRVAPSRQWKLNFETSETYYDPYVKQKFPVIFNLRMDPFESFDGLTDRSDIVQAKRCLNAPVQEILGEHVNSLTEDPPIQKDATFDFSELMKQLQSGKQ